MGFRELDPSLAARLIEGYANAFDGEQRSADAFYRQFNCRRCGGSCQKELIPKHAFADPSVLLARYVLRCVMCRHLFDPHSGLVLELGNLALVPQEGADP